MSSAGTVMRLVTWQPVLSPHQGATWAALQSEGIFDLVCISTRGYSVDRVRQGWVTASAATYREVQLRGAQRVLSGLRILWRSREACHVFCSPFEDLGQIAILLAAVVIGCRIYLVSEPFNTTPDPYHGERSSWAERVKAHIRPHLYWAYGKLLARSAAGVFAISSLAVRQYRAIGFKPSRVYGFGYFVDSPGAHDGAPKVPDGEMLSRTGTFVFFGGTQKRKGLDFLLGAVARAQESVRGIRLHVYGPGIDSARESLQPGVVYKHPVQFGDVPQCIVGYAAVVVPSTFDGWGVIVNEAIAAGVPVICSKAVGAHSVVERYGCGVTFIAGDLEGLATILMNAATDAEGRKKMASQTVAAAAALRPEVAAEYLARVLQSPTAAAPISPWY